MKLISLILAVLAFLISPAQAKHRHHRHGHHHEHHHVHRVAAPAMHQDCNILFPCEIAKVVLEPVHAIASGLRHGADEASVILPNPAGCPSRAFCGCAVAMHVFGKPVRALWLASNWFRFARSVPGPGMVAVRKHHVFFIEAVLKKGLVLAYDPNSGGHLTRMHYRRLNGFVVVNPHANAS
jgi:hypothetical protein